MSSALADLPADVHFRAVAPPKRRSTGRTTPKGTRPGERAVGDTPGSAPLASFRPTASSSSSISASSRYTPPVAHDLEESPRWLPIVMAILLGLGAVTILLRYLVWQDTNWPVLIGLGFLLSGLWLATRWR